MNVFVVVNNWSRSRIGTFATYVEAARYAQLLEERAGSFMWFGIEPVSPDAPIADPLRLARSCLRLAARSPETGEPAIQAIHYAHRLNDRYSLGLDILAELMKLRHSSEPAL